CAFLWLIPLSVATTNLQPTALGNSMSCRISCCIMMVIHRNRLRMSQFKTWLVYRNSTISAWLAFLAIGTLWAVVTPLGEGFDEPWHVAYVQHIAQTGKVPLGHSVYVSQEIDLFLHTHPVSWGLHKTFSSLQSYEEYWQQRSE